MAVSDDQIRAALAAFDGRRVAPLKSVVAGSVDAKGVAYLLAALPGEDEIGASWMLKALAESGRLQADDLSAFLAKLPGLREPDAILHLLQCAQNAAPPVARQMRDALTPLYRHARGLVRVWAFDAYCRGADLPAEQRDIAERIGIGLKDRYAAMRARSRALARDFGVNPDA